MSQFQSGYPTALREMNFMARVYSWMSAALTITAISAYWVFNTPAVFSFIFTHPAVVIVLMIAQVALVFVISGLLQRLSFVSASALFIIYSLLLGISLSTVFAVYTTASIVTTFAITAGTFAAMAIYGYFTKSDLTTLGNILFMGLIGLIIAGLVNMFLQSEKFDVVISGIGVLVFTLLIAYDAQKIKYLGQQLLADREEINKIALLGALTLYLDFVNLFLYLLRFFGKSRDSE